MSTAVQVGPFRWTRRTYRAACAAIAITSVVVAGTGAYLVAQAGKTTTVDLDTVLEDFRTATTAPATTDTSAPAVPVESTDTTAAPVAEQATTTSTAPPTTVAQPVSAPATTAPPTTAAPAGPAPFTRPAEGVYTYGVSGSEKISVAGANHKYPGEIYAVVTHTACGYQIVLNILAEHVDTITFCLDGTRLSLVQIQQKITFLGQTQTGAIACQPATLFMDRATPGAQSNANCGAGSIKATGPVTYQGDASVSIDGGNVTGSVVQWRWTAQGDSSGGGTMTWTFGPDGLPLRLERSAKTTAPTVLGRVAHEESAKFVLRSRTPRR